MNKKKVISMMLALVMIFSVSAPAFADTIRLTDLLSQNNGMVLNNGDTIEIVSEDISYSKDNMFSSNNSLTESAEIVYLINGVKYIHKIETLSNGDISINVSCPSDVNENDTYIIKNSELPNLDYFEGFSSNNNNNLKTSTSINDNFVTPNYNHTYYYWEEIGYFEKNLRLGNYIYSQLLGLGIAKGTALLASYLKIVYPHIGAITWAAYHIVTYIKDNYVVSPYTEVRYHLSYNPYLEVYRYENEFYVNGKHVEDSKDIAYEYVGGLE